MRTSSGSIRNKLLQVLCKHAKQRKVKRTRKGGMRQCQWRDVTNKQQQQQNRI